MSALLPEIETKSHLEIKQFQEEKLSTLLSYVNTHSKFYQTRFKENNIAVSDIKTLNNLQKIPVTTTTLFKPGSISKSLNAVGVLKLAQENKLDINKDINDYLKSWKFPYDSLSKGKKITTANLLSHTAGLSVYGGFPGYDAKL